MRHVPIVLSLSLSLIVPAASASAQPRVIDRSSPTSEEDPIPLTLAIGGGSGQILFQVVTAGIDGRLFEVRVPLACDAGALRLEIRDVDAVGMPGPTVVSAQTFDARRFPGPVTDEYRALAVRPPLALRAGDRFTIALSNAAGSCGVWQGPTGDPYAGGNGWFFAAPNTTIAPLGLGTGREDLPFETVMRPVRRP